MKTYIGIDNGVSGTIGIIPENGNSIFIKTPVFKVQDYTKAKKLITRLDAVKFFDLLSRYADNAFLLLERPMLNPQRWTASVSAARCHESMLSLIELIGIPFAFIDSKEWQKALLPSGIEKEELKTMSRQIGDRLFPQFKDVKHPDRDGILIAEYARRKNL